MCFIYWRSIFQIFISFYLFFHLTMFIIPLRSPIVTRQSCIFFKFFLKLFTFIHKQQRFALYFFFFWFWHFHTSHYHHFVCWHCRCRCCLSIVYVLILNELPLHIKSRIFNKSTQMNPTLSICIPYICSSALKIA